MGNLGPAVVFESLKDLPIPVSVTLLPCDTPEVKEGLHGHHMSLNDACKLPADTKEWPADPELRLKWKLSSWLADYDPTRTTQVKGQQGYKPRLPLAGACCPGMV